MNLKSGYMPTVNYPGSITNEWRLKNLFDHMNQAVKHTPDLLPNGDLYVRQHCGIASGFFQTQILGSMYNSLLLFTILRENGIKVEDIATKVQGDDSIIAINEFVPPSMHQTFLDALAATALKRFDAVPNTKKSRISNTLNGLPVLEYTNRHG
jgi:hypothetical protein